MMCDRQIVTLLVSVVQDYIVGGIYQPMTKVKQAPLVGSQGKGR